MPRPLTLKVDDWEISIASDGRTLWLYPPGYPRAFEVPLESCVFKARLEDLLDLARAAISLLDTGHLLAQIEGTCFLMKRLGEDRWLMRAQGNVDYELELRDEEAILMWLYLHELQRGISWHDISMLFGYDEEELTDFLFRHFRTPAQVIELGPYLGPRPIRTRPIRIRKEVIISLLRGRLYEAEAYEEGARAEVHIIDGVFHLVLQELGRHPVLRLLDVSGSLEKRVMRLPDDVALDLLTGIARLSEVLRRSRAMIQARKWLVRKVFASEVSKMKFRGSRVLVENEWGTWSIDLKSGELHLNEHYICLVQEGPSPYGVVVLPDVGELKLDETTARVLCAVSVALRPDEVKDEDLMQQIKEAAADR